MAEDKPSRKIKSNNFDQEGETEKWQDGERFSEGTILKRKEDGKRGISVRTGKETQKYKNYNKGIWLDENTDVPGWMGWFIGTLKRLYFRLAGKELNTEEHVKQKEKEVEVLQQQLLQTQQELAIAKQTDVERKQLIVFAQKAKEHAQSFKDGFAKFKSMIEESKTENKGKEEAIKDFIKKNPWLLGLECYVEAKNKDVDTQAEIDLHVITKYGQDRIFEIKSPNIKPFKRKDGNPEKRVIMSPELSEALSELVIYMRKTNVYSKLEREGVYGIQKAPGYILIGSGLDKAEEEMRKELNFHLSPNIQIITYDELLQNIGMEMSIIESAQTPK